MKKIRFTPLIFRRIHKWVGLILGVQFLLWALSGSMMALLDQEKVGGHSAQASHQHALPAGDYIAPAKGKSAMPLLPVASPRSGLSSNVRKSGVDNNSCRTDWPLNAVYVPK